jgi:hypothetical protein
VVRIWQGPGGEPAEQGTRQVGRRQAAAAAKPH